MVDVNALNLVLWAVLISSLAAVGLAAAGIAWAWLAERSRRADEVASGIRAAEDHLAVTAKQHTAS
jgi:hypothetical protein